MSTKKILIFHFLILISFCLPVIISAQNGSIYIDPNRGEKTYRKTQIMNANQVESIFGNWGIFGKRDDPYSGVWPKGTGHGHIHEMTMIIGGEVIGTDGKKYQIISDSYSESPDRAPDGTEFFWNPLPGYANDYRRFTRSDGTMDTTSLVASSSDNTTWPATWPGKDNSWDGKWNGYFGQSDANRPDMECIYVADDFMNSEFPYYPVLSDTTKRGLGMQVETRLFQWAHSLAANQIFIHFQVTNVSDVIYDKNLYLGAFADVHPGGLGSVKDWDSFSKEDNMIYAWAEDNLGVWTTYPEILPGYMAWMYLESPGIPEDGIDNDSDGLIDEKRDNDAGAFIFGPVGNYGPPKDHFEGDEDGDWDPQIDDVGSDGIGPLDPFYEAPDQDGTEGNGRPDQGEPNFGKTDNDESDQMGLTSFYAPEYGVVFSKNDEALWTRIQPGTFQTPANGKNNLWIFASGPFNLQPKKTERFSVCWMFGAEEKEIFRNAITSQSIYDKDYRFTKPPIQPIVKAVPGDQKVTLYWDDVSEKSVDPIYQKDFEGYRIYRGTDPQMTEANTITNGYGNKAYYKPIAQFDLIDGLKGMHPIALGQELGAEYSSGIHYYMGNDSGLKYYFEDNSVTNGQTYYYAVVGYDKGYFDGMDDRNLFPMSPAESPFTIDYQYGSLLSVSRNVAIVTPDAPATNYNAGHTDADSAGFLKALDGSLTTGKVNIQVIDPEALPENNEYQVTFVDSLNAIGENHTTTYSVKNLTTGEEIFNESIPLDQDGNKYLTWSSTIFNGMQLNFENTEPDLLKINALSGWSEESQTNLKTTIGVVQGKLSSDFVIEITDQPAQYQYEKNTPVYLKVYEKNTLDSMDFILTEVFAKRDGKLNYGEQITIMAKPNGSEKLVRSWTIRFLKPEDVSITPIDPQPGDKFNFFTDIPFKAIDRFKFKTAASKTKAVNTEVLNNIAVVPNPYLLAASWERASDIGGRGEKKISFIHLPAECTIRIFTQNGNLIRTIQHFGLSRDGSESWDLTTSEGLEVAFGIYVFHIEAPGLGQKIGTFAIIN